MLIRDVIGSFFDGFGPGTLSDSRPGAPTQVFASDEVPFSMTFQNRKIEVMLEEFEGVGTKGSGISVRTAV